MTDDKPDVDPEEFLRALLKISQEDAAKVREAAAEKMRSGHWRGDEDNDDQGPAK